MVKRRKKKYNRKGKSWREEMRELPGRNIYIETERKKAWRETGNRFRGERDKMNVKKRFMGKSLFLKIGVLRERKAGEEMKWEEREAVRQRMSWLQKGK